MVSVGEARSQLVEQRSIIESQRQGIQQISLPTLTAAQVRQQTRQSIITRGQQGEELERLKTTEIKKFEPFEKELDKFESQIKNVETKLKQQKERQAAFRKALDVFSDPDPRALFGLSGLEEEFFRKISQGKTTAIRLQIEKTIKGIEKKGLKAIPIFKEGKLIAFKGEPIIKPTLIPAEKIIFGQPEKFARSFQQATGSESFTIAIPLRRENGKIRVQDFNFRFEDGKIVKSTATGIALLTEEQFLAADKRRREKTPGFTFGTTIPTIPFPKAITLPGELPPPISPIKPPGKIKQFLRKIEQKIPFAAPWVTTLEALGLTREIVKPGVIPTLVPPSELVTADIRPFIPTGQGTAIVTPRQKTFFEINKINPKSPSSIKLFEDVQRIEADFEDERISETVANKRLETASDDFTRSQIKEGIPRDIALGVAFGITQQIPIVKTIAQVALIGEFIFQRKNILKQFKKFPRETVLSTAGFIGGGLIAVGIIAYFMFKPSEEPPTPPPGDVGAKINSFTITAT
ncbi:hypothetical protein LCGC14_2119320 [marine sediment metagenome]|uniref:Uncharacterized protein n=1 Tax=marine sediment metagenome TaxID=412755 RepID=A0A0F8VD83_9ZZZZ